MVAQLLSNIDPNRFDIHLACITADGPGATSPPFYVYCYRLNCSRVRYAALPVLRMARTLRPDIILSGMAHLNWLLLFLSPLIPPSTRILIRQNTTASLACPNQLASLFYRFLYPRANVIICQSEEMGEDLAVHFGIARNKLKVLYNPIDPITPSGRFDVSIATELWPQNAWPRLLAVGRLSPEKGFDLLIHAVSRLRKHYPQIHARILGSGPQEAALKQLAADLGLLEALSFPGHIRNVAAYYDGTTLFALSSRHEGMPNALLEAAMAGLPIVSTPCSSGLSQLLSTASGTWISHEISARSLVATLATALAILTKAQHDRFNGPSEQPLRFDHAFIKPFRTPIAIAAYEELIAAQAALCRRNLS